MAETDKDELVTAPDDAEQASDVADDPVTEPEEDNDA